MHTALPRKFLEFGRLEFRVVVGLGSIESIGFRVSGLGFRLGL